MRRAKKIFFPFLLFAFCLIFVFGNFSAQESAEEIFEKAFYYEDVQGDLEKAIELYEQILKQFPENREIAAKAQLQIGICYEKQGLQDAEEAFQKVIDNYPDQTEIYKAAQEKLSILQRAKAIVEKEEQGLKMIPIPWDRGKYWFYTISPDGKKLAGLTGKLDIWITDIASGEEVQITNTGKEGWIYWAPDSQKLASMDANGDFKVVPVQGGTPKILFKPPETSEEFGGFMPTSWSLDCQHINCWFYKKGLFAIPISGGEWKEIFTYSNPEDTETHTFPILSPNEKFLVYSDTTGNKDIYIMPAEGGEPTQLTDHPAKDVGRLLSYDGRWLIFNSNRNGKNERWIIGISPDGKREGVPFQVPLLSEANLGMAGWTKENQIAFAYSKTISNLFMSNADGSEENQLTNMEWWDGAARWSPDGQSIAFISDRGGKTDIWLMPAQGGEPKNISAHSGVGGLGNLTWHPNGLSISSVAGPSQGILNIDIENGSAERIPFEFFNLVQGMDWSPDGKRIAFCFFHPSDIEDSQLAKNPHVYTIPSEGGEAVILTKVEEDNLSCGSPRWSPDGKKIAFADDTGRVWVANSEGGDPRAITDAIKEKSVGTIMGAWVVGWSPDGENIFFHRGRGGEKEERGYYSVPSQGGALQKLNIEASDLDVSPDGKKYVYNRITKNINEYWLLENFLPEKK
ncbi:tetratricopeptide repeat protein [Acidobacteriota bacterium]